MSAEERRALLLALVLLAVGLSARLHSRWNGDSLKLEQDPDSLWSLEISEEIREVASEDSVVPTLPDTGSIMVAKPVSKPRPAGKIPWNGTMAINRAGADELQQLPGIGPALARRIVEHRARAGNFSEASDLLQVKGIGEKKLKRILPFLIFD